MEFKRVNTDGKVQTEGGLGANGYADNHSCQLLDGKKREITRYRLPLLRKAGAANRHAKEAAMVY